MGIAGKDEAACMTHDNSKYEQMNVINLDIKRRPVVRWIYVG